MKQSITVDILQADYTREIVKSQLHSIFACESTQKVVENLFQNVLEQDQVLLLFSLILTVCFVTVKKISTINLQNFCYNSLPLRFVFVTYLSFTLKKSTTTVELKLFQKLYQCDHKYTIVKLQLVLTIK